MLEKAATIKRFEYSPLGRKVRKQTDIAKDQYKFFKGQMNAINNSNRKDDIKKEKDQIDDVDHNYIGHEQRDLIDNIFKFKYGMEICVSQNFIIENLP